MDNFNYLGILSIIVFYLLILGVGMWAARKKGGEEMDQEVRKFITRFVTNLLYYLSNSIRIFANQ